MDITAARAPRASTPQGFAAPACYSSIRCVRNVARQPAYIVVLVAQPLTWLIFVDAVFHAVVQLQGFPIHQYITFLAPGIIAMSAFISGGINGTGMLRDIENGVLDQMLTLPISRASVFCGRLGLQLAISAVQTTVVLSAAILMGAHFSNGPLGIMTVYLLSWLLGGALATLSNAGALILRSDQALNAITNFVLFPATFLSSAFMPRQDIFGWIDAIARYNPLNWTAEAAREALSPASNWVIVILYGSRVAAFAICCGALSWYAMRTYRKRI